MGFIENYQKKHKLNFCLGIISSGFEVMRAKVFHNDVGTERLNLLKNNPKSFLYIDLEDSCKYSAVINKKTHSALVFAYRKKVLNEIEQFVSEMNFEIVRLQSGLNSILEYLAHYQPEDFFCDSVFLVVDKNAFVSILFENEDWEQIGFWLNSDTNDLLDSLPEILKRISENFNLIRYINLTDMDLNQTLSESFPETEIKEYLKSDKSLIFYAVAQG